MCVFSLRSFVFSCLCPFPLFQHLVDIIAGIGPVCFCNFLRSPAGNDSSSAVSSFRSHINDIIRRLYNIQIMFDDHNAVSPLYQLLKDLRQLADILKMQTGCGLIQDVNSLSRGSSGKLRRQLDSLCLSPLKARYSAGQASRNQVPHRTESGFCL